jgi:hypothetical protein
MSAIMSNVAAAFLASGFSNAGIPFEIRLNAGHGGATVGEGVKESEHPDGCHVVSAR